MANDEYCEMIELPVSSCEMVTVPQKKRAFSKKKLLKKINEKAPIAEAETEAPTESAAQPEQEISTVTYADKNEKNKKTKNGGRFKFTLVGAEVVAIFVLIVAIMLTNIFWEDSGINVMIRSVFGQTAKTTDDRTARELAVFAPTSADNLTASEGVISFKSACAVYPTTDGTVESVTAIDGSYTITINHSDVFRSVIENADATYVSVGDKAYPNVPIALSKQGTTLKLYDNNVLVTDYILKDGNIVWES